MKRKSVEDLRMEAEINSKFLSIIEILIRDRDWYLIEDENGNMVPPKYDLNDYNYIWYTANQRAIDILLDSNQ